MTQFEEGHYWLKINNEWTIAEYEDGQWWLIGSDFGWKKLPENVIVGDRILRKEVCNNFDMNNEDDCLKAVIRWREYCRQHQMIVMEGEGILYPGIDVGRMLIMCEKSK